MKSFGATVVELREARGLTQGALGQLVGVTGPQIARIESGKRDGSAKVLTAIARELGIDLNLLKSSATSSPAGGAPATVECIPDGGPSAHPQTIAHSNVSNRNQVRTQDSAFEPATAGRTAAQNAPPLSEDDVDTVLDTVTGA